jgi:phospholipid transport system substrate-binding protein
VSVKFSKVLGLIGFSCVVFFGANTIASADAIVKKAIVKKVVDNPNKLVVNPYNFLTDNFKNLQVDIEKAKESFKKDKKAKKSFDENPDRLYKIIKEVVLPNLAVNQMAGTVLGPKWKKATPKQREEFIGEFSKLLTRSYAIALLKVTHYEVKIRPLRGSSWKTQKIVTLQAKIINKSNNQSSSAVFYLQRSGNSWKIFDLAVEGVSIVKNFREQFDSFKSMKDLLDKLAVLNKAAEASK